MTSSPAAHRTLLRLLAPLRHSALSQSDQVVLSCQLAAWALLAERHAVPDNLQPDESLWDGRRLATTFEALQGLRSLGSDAAGFQVNASQLATLTGPQLSALMSETRSLAAAGFLGPDLYPEALAALQGMGSSGVFTLPQELLDLLIGLAAPQPEEEVYLPFDGSLQLSLAAAAAGARPFAEFNHPSPLPYLGNLLAGQPAELRISDPLRAPSYTEGSQLRRFLRSVLFTPLGHRADPDLYVHDLYGRFPERTTASHVLAVRHVLAQTSRRAVILTANNLLFGVGAERSLREDLVERGLSTVLSLPPALLFGSNIPLSILVVDPERHTPEGSILFINGEDARFHQRDGKSRTTLTGWAELLQAVHGKDDLAAVRVSKTTIADNDYQLMVRRYVRSDAGDAVEAALKDGEVQALEDLVEFIRPVPALPAGSDPDLGIAVPEVGAADLQEQDFIRRPEKAVRLSALKNALQPLDILIAVKGSVGKVGLVPPDLAEDWVAGPTCLVLRLKDRQRAAGHSPQSLFMYLRSALGKAMLERIKSGASVPLIQLRELRKLAVPVGPVEVLRRAEQALDASVAIQREITSLQERQSAIATGVWGLADRANSPADGAL